MTVTSINNKDQEENDRPKHIVVVMDGNGRWAKKRFMPRTAGHHAGVKSTRKIVEESVKNKIQALTLFAFSSENWKRPEQEVSSLMELFVSTLQSEINSLHKQNVRVRFIGEISAFSEKLQKKIKETKELTENNTGLQLNIAVNYGGRWDIAEACKSIVKKIQLGELQVCDIDAELIDEFVCLKQLPEPDLFIRTGGEMRISNFLIWQLAYTELYFTDVLWPDFKSEEFSAALNWYAGRQRRFGKTGEQVEPTQTQQV
ncbi:MAG: isoprenyl transferase [endosymbiont of Galathealinum brachiosum]|uniref:Ditrans,polycis-undecaprenyl-diphosphate synthase ((2E,6E)-farnesyl-diphosphate specific) n=1 Tax=endosymbiont of Galathealinum brachiosum TaxID=2200906 RepID=A0A370DL12_9GAMM|nr:MAG: isoprenyl transferase [endosymbiont of Galathealinum brachiosum]